MKKKILMLVTAILTAGVMAGCGSSDEIGALKDVKTGKYLTLGEYKGIAVTVSAKEQVLEEDVNTLILNAYNSSVTADESNIITDRAVENGDTVNIDYVGTQDDVAFEGGTAAGAQLVIGSNSFIDGFESGLIGVMPGETVDLELTFPESYSRNESLAGQAVVFRVTVNHIYNIEQATVVSDISDEQAFAATNYFNTVQEMYDYFNDYLTNLADSNYTMETENAVIEALLTNTTFKNVPEGLVQKYNDNIVSSLTSQATYYGTDADTFANYYYGMDAATYATTYAEDNAKQALILQAIANEEDLNIDDTELQELLQQYATDNGYESVEDVVGESDTESLREYFLFEKVLNFVIENAVVTEQ